MPDHPVVVVGAGPTGVTVATLLAQYGVDVLVLDRWSSVFPQPRAVHLDDEVFRILARLGVAEDFARISRPSEGLRLMDPHHRVLADFRRERSAGRHGFPAANMFDQPDLEALLRETLHRQPRVTFRGDVEVDSIQQPADGPVRISFTDRVTGETDTALASYVLGCDGANSVVRRSIGAALRDLNFEQRWLVVDVNTDHDLGQWEGVHQVCDTERAATYMQISDRRHRWEFQLRDAETSAEFEEIAGLQPLIAPWTGDLPADHLEIVRVAEYTFRAQLAERWRDRRVFLLGDAAHLTPPFIGQGMGAGLRDAMNLAWKLAAVLDGRLPESILDSYEQERRPHARHMIRLAVTVGTLMTRGGRLGNLLRRVLAPRLQLLPGFGAKLLDSATPPLHSSQFVRRPRRRGLAGTLCPNAPVGDAGRFDDVVGGRFALVTTESTADPDGVVVLRARPGEPLHEWLTAGRATAAVVRPDGTVLSAAPSVRAALDPLVSLSGQMTHALPRR